MKEFEALRERLAVLCPQLELRTQEPMSRHTTFRVGGPCALMALPKSENEARAAVTAAHEMGISPFFLYYRDDTIYSIASVSITNFTFPSIPLSFPLNVV